MGWNSGVVSNYNTLQITTAHAKSFQSAFTSRFLVTNLNNGYSLTARTKSFLHRLPYSLLLTTPKLVSVITSRHGPLITHRSLFYSKLFRGNVFCPVAVFTKEHTFNKETTHTFHITQHSTNNTMDINKYNEH
jgi:hypothetical protein